VSVGPFDFGASTWFSLQEKEERGPSQELALSSSSSVIFCNQVFFDNGPSSSTSLLSSVGVSTRECRCDATAGSRRGHSKVPPRHARCLTDSDSGGDDDGGGGGVHHWSGPWTGAHQTNASSCDLLQPGLL